MKLSEGNEKFHFITGKGGVGKTVVSCALAMHYSRLKRDVLLVSINPSHAIEENFNQSVTATPCEVLKIDDHLWASNLEEANLFDRFIHGVVKIKALSDRIISSPVYKYFAAVAPGIKELITQEVLIDAMEGKNMFEAWNFDTIIIDSPSTGHGMSWFSVSDSVISAFPAGPMFSRAERIRHILSDRNLTAIHLVTLPEEMPVNETIEYYWVLKDKLGLPVQSVILNEVIPELSSNDFSVDEIGSVLPCISLAPGSYEQSISGDQVELIELINRSGFFYWNRRKLYQTYRAHLVKHIPLPLLEIPLYFTHEGPLDLIHRIEQEISSSRS